MRLFFHLLIAGLLAASSAWAQSPVASDVLALDSRGEAQLEAGRRTRVIVQFELPQIAFDGLDRETRDVMQTEAIDREARAVLQRVFAASPEAMANSAASARHERPFRYTPAMVMTLSRDEIDRLAQDPAVVRISSDGLDRPMLDETVPQIGASILHQTGLRGQGATIAILDSGIIYDHPAFIGRIADSACFSTSNEEDGATTLCPNGEPTDLESEQAAIACSVAEDSGACAHGTHVASIAAGAPGQNSHGTYNLTGVAPEANLLPVQVFSLFSNEDICGAQERCVLSYISDQLRALEWLYENSDTQNVTVVNLSLGGDAQRSFCSADPRKQVIGYLRLEEIVTVAASGNQGDPDGVSPPGCIAWAVAVGGLSPTNEPRFNTGRATDFLAPSTANAAGDSRAGNLVAQSSGTSMAAPHVSGVFALLRPFTATQSLSEVQQVLVQTGTPIPIFASPGRIIPAVRADLAAIALEQEFGPVGQVSVTPDRDLILAVEQNANNDNSRVEFQIVNGHETSIDWEVRYEGSALAFDHAFTQVFDARSQTTIIYGTVAAGARVTIGVTPQVFPLAGEFEEVLEFRGPDLLTQRSLVIRVNHDAPPNDSFENPLLLSGEDFTAIARLRGATSQAMEPDHGSDGRSVWFTWTAPVSADFQIASTTDGLSVFNEADFDELEANRVGTRYDPGGGGYDSAVDISARRGDVFYIALDASSEEELSNHGLRFRPTPLTYWGDSPSRPFWLAGASGTFDRSVSTRLDPADFPDEPEPVAGTTRRAWFAWTSPFSGTLRISAQSEHSPPGSIAVYRRTDNANAHNEGDAWNLLEEIGMAEFEAANTPLDQRFLDVPVETGRTYWFRIGRILPANFLNFSFGQPRHPEHSLRAAILPSSRTALLGAPTTTFLSLINPARFGIEARNCRVETTSPDAIVNYWLTDTANNAVGDANPEFNIPVGGLQTLVLQIMPSSLSGGPDNRIALNYLCANVAPDRPVANADQFDLYVTDIEAPDIVAIAATPTGDGVLNLREGRRAAFSVAAINIGADAEDLAVFATPYFPHRVAFTVCQTDASTGACLDDNPTSTARLSLARGELATFTVFAQENDYSEPFNPASNRFTVVFSVQSETDYSGTVGMTSVAVRPPAE